MRKVLFIILFLPIFMCGQTTITICNGDSIQIGWNTYHTPGAYIDTVATTWLCDSVVYTTLDFYQSPYCNLFVIRP